MRRARFDLSEWLRSYVAELMLVIYWSRVLRTAWRQVITTKTLV